MILAKMELFGKKGVISPTAQALQFKFLVKSTKLASQKNNPGQTMSGRYTTYPIEKANEKKNTTNVQLTRNFTHHQFNRPSI